MINQENRTINYERLHSVPNFQAIHNPFWSRDESSDDDLFEDEKSKYEPWKILKNRGHGWKVIRDQVGRFNTYFFAYKQCSKQQVIDLYEVFPEASLFRSDFQVKVSISEYFKFCGIGRLLL